MPTYSFRNDETEEQFDKILSFNARVEYLASNPHITQIHTKAPGLVSNAGGLGSLKTDGGFNDLLNRIGKANPGTALSGKHVSKNATEVAVDQVAKKHQFRQE
tara:strand:- start:7882 stop:8190 length:309 start_codon:yes stop_codon:yes gene_type:complete